MCCWTGVCCKQWISCEWKAKAGDITGQAVSLVGVIKDKPHYYTQWSHTTIPNEATPLYPIKPHYYIPSSHNIIPNEATLLHSKKPHYYTQWSHTLIPIDNNVHKPGVCCKQGLSCEWKVMVGDNMIWWMWSNIIYAIISSGNNVNEPGVWAKVEDILSSHTSGCDQT